MKEIILHPTRVRIIQLLSYHKSMTVASLAENMVDTPRPTIYRHVRILHENGIITVVKEQKIRGTYEREYGLNVDYEYVKKGQEGRLVSGLLLKLFSDFSNYFELKDMDPVGDQLFVSINSFMLSDEEMESFKKEIFDVIKKHLNFCPEEGRKARNISFISSPCVGEGDITEELI